MEPFTKATGIVAPLDRVNVDTDSIVPARFLKRIEREGWGETLFFDWRFLPDGRPNPEFILNAPGYEDASILVVGRNFGSGSSREHAVWAIQQYGFDAVVSPRFADIFRNNCTKNGLVPVQVSAEFGADLMRAVQADPALEITIDVERLTIEAPAAGLESTFPLDGGTRERFLQGLDDIGLTFRHIDAIDDFEKSRPDWMPIASSSR